MPESDQHKRLKHLITEKLREWIGASVEEYPSSGHELDAFGTTIEGVSVYCEIIWSDSRAHFLEDMNMLQQSDANIKFVIASPNVIKKVEYQREFEKVVVAQRRAGNLVHGQMLDGMRIVEDRQYLDAELKPIVLDLTKRARVELPVRKKTSRLFEFPRRDVRDAFPHRVRETLVSNLFPVIDYPDRIFSGYTRFRRAVDVVAELGWGSVIPPFILREGRVYTFSDMSDSASTFRRLVRSGISQDESESWIGHPDRRNWFVELLNNGLRSYCITLGLKYYRKRRIYFFPGQQGREYRAISWRTEGRRAKRTVAKCMRSNSGRVFFWHHYAADMRFIFVGDKAYLKIEPGIVFTSNGIIPILSRRTGPLTTKWQKREFNAAYRNHVKFWISLLGKQQGIVLIPTEGDLIRVLTNPASTNLNVGIREGMRNVPYRSERMSVKGEEFR